jgi:hypothetical protein
MTTPSRYPLRLSENLRHEAVRMAKKEKTSLNSFIEIAVAERIANLKTTEFFASRAERAGAKGLHWFFNQQDAGLPVMPGDELPEGVNFIKELLDKPSVS